MVENTKKESYYPYQFARVDGRNVFMEAIDKSFQIDKMLINFCKYDGNTKKMAYTIPIYFEIPDFLYLSSIIQNGVLYKQIAKAKAAGDNYKEVYSKYTGIPVSKVGMYKDRLPFDVPQGKGVSKVFSITPSSKYAYYFKATMSLGDESEKGILIPSGKPLATIAIPLTQEAAVGFFRFCEVKMQAFYAAKMCFNAKYYPEMPFMED